MTGALLYDDPILRHESPELIYHGRSGLNKALTYSVHGLDIGLFL